MADFRLEGVDEVIKRLEALGGKEGKNAARRALRQGANVVMRDARERAARLDDPKTAENIARNITVRGGSSRREQRVGGVMMRVGVLGGARNMEAYGEFKGRGKANPGGDTWYWRLLEFGTVKMAARPFMRPALQNNVQAATDAFANSLGVEIDKELAKVK